MKEPQGQKVGKVVHEGGKFFLNVDGQKSELPLGLGANEKQLRALVDQEVEVLYSEPIRFVVALVPRIPRIPHILCYMPAPDTIFNSSIVAAVDVATRTELANRLLSEKVISEAVREKIIE